MTPDTTPEQHHDNMVDFTDKAATGLGAASIWTPSPVNLGLAVLAGAFKTTNYLLKPASSGTALYDSASILIPAYVISQNPWVQTGFSIGSLWLQPIVTPIMDSPFKSPTLCNPPKTC
ncbi:hypothetical protein QN416_23255 [Glaciimonas sp. Cout2]|uniref:hypothetical protein n=2 Tax=Glaciimonas TaxID=1229970 RepID=UPI002AB577B7|nr:MULTISPECIES: hypothetical protein [unclassified Glaciimonas]MDY7548908.1 hypothetical protein [Glaciimonas sp. CA11.2]MEB0014517.1 hypothetical protein [Glaciimonas sp. Cout2]